MMINYTSNWNGSGARLFTGMVVATICCVAFADSALAKIKVVVDSNEAATRAYLAQAGAQVVARRGRHVVLEVDDAAADRARTLPGAQVRDDFDVIALRRLSLDTRGGVGGGAALSSESPGSRRLKLVQFNRPPSDADIRQITATGASIVQYVPQNAYLVWTEGEGGAASLAARVAGTRAIQYYGEFLPEYALAPTLDSALTTNDAIAVTVQLFNHGAGVDAEVAEITRLAERVVAGPAVVVAGTYVNLRAVVRGSRLRSIAEVGSVVNIEPYTEPTLYDERQGQILAANVDPSAAAPSGPGYLTWLAAHGFSTDPADYPVVAVVDDGVDNGTTSPMQSEFYQLNDTALPSRLMFAVVPPGAFTASPDGPDGHGNINASIVGGFNDDTGAAVEDSFGFHYGLGISPYGRIANVRIFAPFFDLGFGNTTMVDDYYQRGARISTNSWGADVFGVYDTFAQEYDALARDAQPSTSGNQPLLFVFAAGNAGPSPRSIGSPGTAKNVLTVGASETANPDAAGGDGCVFTSGDGDDARAIAIFSARGPCVDGRIKPDIVAPGTFIQGAASQPVFTGAGVCGAPTNDRFLPGDDALFPSGSAYTWSSGTSHSTPAIAGYASLMREFLSREYAVSDPSPALQKAFAIHSTRHLAGTGAGEALPGANQGFGIADMGFGFDTTAPRFFHDQATAFGGSGESVTFTGSIVDPAQPVRVALVWTDAPGPTFAAAFVNDLNLTVEHDGAVYRGNNFAEGQSQPGGVADFRNNTEAVFLPAGSSGLTQITVDAANIVGDGVPGNADATDQDFALVVYNFASAVSAGVVFFDRDAFPCGSLIEVSVADADLAGAGSVGVELTTSGSDGESMTLNEMPASSGIFVGTVATSTGAVTPLDGTLQAGDGETITATYDDADHGTGSPATVQAAAGMDCAPPAATNVATTDVTKFGATVTFDTSEAARAVVHYGLSCGALTETKTVEAGTTHAVTLSGLLPGTTYFFHIRVTDAAGNVTIDDNGGSCYSFTTPVPQNCNHPDNVFTNCSFETGDFTGWLVQDIGVPFIPLQIAPAGVSVGFGFFLTEPTEGALSAIHGFDGSGPGTIQLSQDVTLPFTGPPTLTFDYRAAWDLLTYGATLDRELYVDVEPAGGGIPLQSTLILSAPAGTSVPDTGMLAGTVDLADFIGMPVRITFRWVVPENFVGPALFEIDNVSARPSVSSTGTVAFNRPVYPCGATVDVVVSDADLPGAGSARVDLTTSAGDAETLELAEVAPGSGAFRGMIATNAGAASIEDGTLQAGNGETLTVTYADADDGSGSPALAQDTAVVDCAGPVISNVAISGVTSRAATISLQTNEVATAQARYGLSCDQLTATMSGVGATTAHTIALSGLQSATPYFYRVEATDVAGNVSVDDNDGACYAFTTLVRPDFFTEWFIDNDNDLDNHTLTFTPDGTASFYRACATAASAFPTNPADGEVLVLPDDGFVEVALTGGNRVSLYGVSHGSFFVGSNGYITFGQGDFILGGGPEMHFNLPRVSALFDDLNPSVGGSVSWKQLADRVAVTFQNVPQYATADSNSFQIELFFNGTIRVTYLAIDATDGLAGLSAGAGLTDEYEDSDLTGYHCSTTSSLCRSTPHANCNTSTRPRRSLLIVKDKPRDARDALYWEMRRIEDTAMAEFGNPLSDTDYALCIYAGDSMELQMETVVPAGGTCGGRPCWWALASNGFRYVGNGTNTDGVRRLVLHAGVNGRASIRVEGRGAALPMPSMPMAQDDMVMVQLVNSAGTCWDAHFRAPAAKNTNGHFRDRSE